MYGNTNGKLNEVLFKQPAFISICQPNTIPGGPFVEQSTEIHDLLVLYTDELLASQSDAHTIAPHRDPIHPTHPNPLIVLEQENPEKTHDVIYF